MSLRYKGGLISPSVNPLAANITTSPNVAQYNGVFTLQQQAQALNAGQWAIDPYYKNTTLLLHADGKANGSQNNTFLDSSTNNFTITRNGNTTQGSFTPYGPDWSNYSDGSGYLSAPSNAVFAFGTGDFTVECWIFLTSTTSAPYNNPRAFNVGGFNLYSDNANSGKWAVYFGSSNIITTTASLTLNQWTHLALVRSGTSLVLYINGVSAGSTTNSSNISAAAAYFLTSGSTDIATGYLSNARIVKGVAVYTGTFTVPTSPLSSTQSAGTNISAITGSQTSLLTAQSNRFVDNSSSPLTITTGGSPSVQRFSPFPPQYQYTPAVIGGSAYFDGSGDYLTASQNAAFNIGTGAFTAEAWIYPTAGMAGGGHAILNLGNGANGGGPYTGWGLLIEYATSTTYTVGWYRYDGSTETNLITSSTLGLNQWSHIVAVRSGTTLSIYINGVRGYTTSSSSVSYNNINSDPLNIGFRNDGAGGNHYYSGYICGDRLVVGTAVYDPTSSTLTVPTAPPTAVSGTQFLTNFTNAGIYDNAMMNNLETVGNAQVSTSVVKYGSGSLAFDGSGDYLASPVGNLNCDLSNGDFTVECWVNLNSVSGAQIVVARSAYNATVATDVQFAIYANGTSLVVRPYQSTTDYSITVGTVTTGTWYHVALVRQGNVFSGYLNGVKSNTTQTISGALNNNTGWYGILLGNFQATGANQYLNGYIDDLRITKGVARYTANFQPPKVAFANQ